MYAMVAMAGGPPRRAPMFGDEDLQTEEVIRVMHRDAEGAPSDEPEDWHWWSAGALSHEVGTGIETLRAQLQFLKDSGRVITRLGTMGRTFYKLTEAAR